MEDQAYYTLATWRVKPGREEEFEAAWMAMGEAFGAMPGAPTLEGTLLQRLDEPGTFVSFGRWPDLEAIQRMRSDPDAGQAMAAVKACCQSADPAAYRVVRVAQSGPGVGPDPGGADVARPAGTPRT